MKKFMLTLVAIMLIVCSCFSVKAENKKVKVYVFVAGGCGWCEKEINYLKGLDSYNKKFEIVEKKLYTDTASWGKDKDYDLAVKVAEVFNNSCFNDATTDGTPFVIISDEYAMTTYNDNLESYINTAYEKGDKDIVGCVEKGGDCTVPSRCENGNNNNNSNSNNNDNNTNTYNKEDSGSNIAVIVALFAVLFGGMTGLIIIAAKKD